MSEIDYREQLQGLTDALTTSTTPPVAYGVADQLDRIATALEQIASFLETQHQTNLKAEFERLNRRSKVMTAHFESFERRLAGGFRPTERESRQHNADEDQMIEASLALESFLAAHPEFREGGAS